MVPSLSPTSARSTRRAKLAVVGLVLLALSAAWYFGLLAHLREPRALTQALAGLGTHGQLAFVAAYALLQPFGVPGTIFIVAAPLIWPWPLAFALSIVGTMLASVIGFSFARFVAKDWLSARIPARFRKYDEALERSAFQTVVLLRLIFWMPQLLHCFFGVSKVPFWTHFWGSLLGYVPPLLLVSFLGAEMFDASGAMQPAAWPALGALLALSLLVAVLARVQARWRD